MHKNPNRPSLLMFLLRVSSPGPVDDEEPERDRPVAGPKEPRRSVADTRERRPRVPPEDILLEYEINTQKFASKLQVQDMGIK